MKVFISQLRTTPDKLRETQRDVAQGRLSRSVGPPLIARMGDRTYMVQDGHHRAVEAAMRGERRMECVVNPHNPTAYGWHGIATAKVAAEPEPDPHP